MTVEAQVLRDTGVFESLIPTLLKARKATSRQIYCILKSFFGVNTGIPIQEITCIMAFLQSGLDQNVAFNTLKGQASTLSELLALL